MGFKLPKVGLELKKLDSKLDSMRKDTQEFKTKTYILSLLMKKLLKM